MKKLLAILAASGLLASQAGAVSGTPAKVTTEVEWEVIDDFETNTTTYWTKITGNYDIEDLGAAKITATEGGTLSIYTTGVDWSTPNGIGLTSNTNPYQVRTTETDPEALRGHMSLYIGHPNNHQYGGIEYHVNEFNYRFSLENGNVRTESYEDFWGNTRNTVMPTTAFSHTDDNGDPAMPAYGTPGNSFTFGYSLGGAYNEDGTLAGLLLSTPEEFVTPDGRSLTLDAWINNETRSQILPNMGYGFDLTALVSYGSSTLDNTGVWALNDEAETYVVITKALRADAVRPIPEPTTATLSLLVLAGLAARRRRK